MSAEVMPVGAWKYRAWCDECMDGVNVNTHTGAEAWACIHNSQIHGVK